MNMVALSTQVLALLFHIYNMPNASVPFETNRDLTSIAAQRLVINDATRASSIDQYDVMIQRMGDLDLNKTVGRSRSYDIGNVDHDAVKKNTDRSAVVDSESSFIAADGVRDELEGEMSVVHPSRAKAREDQGQYTDDRSQKGNEDTSNRGISNLDSDDVGSGRNSDLLAAQTSGNLVFFVLILCCFGTAYGLALLLRLLTTGDRTRDAVIGLSNAILWPLLFTQFF